MALTLTPAHSIALEALEAGATTNLQVGKQMLLRLDRPEGGKNKKIEEGRKILESLERLGFVRFRTSKGGRRFVWDLTVAGREHLEFVKENL
jgi:hypothetical protein